jgi:hypothetical protein
MSVNVNIKNLEKLKKYVHAQRNIKPNRNSRRTAHLQVKQYGQGDVWEINPKELDYLVLWAIEESVVLSERTLTYNIRLAWQWIEFLPGEENEQEVMSDTIQVLLDFRCLLQTVAYNRFKHPNERNT